MLKLLQDFMYFSKEGCLHVKYVILTYLISNICCLFMSLGFVFRIIIINIIILLLLLLLLLLLVLLLISLLLLLLLFRIALLKFVSIFFFKDVTVVLF